MAMLQLTKKNHLVAKVGASHTIDVPKGTLDLVKKHLHESKGVEFDKGKVMLGASAKGTHHLKAVGIELKRNGHDNVFEGWVQPGNNATRREIKVILQGMTPIQNGSATAPKPRQPYVAPEPVAKPAPAAQQNEAEKPTAKQSFKTMYWNGERIETLVGLLRHTGSNISQEDLHLAVTEVYRDIHHAPPAEIILGSAIGRLLYTKVVEIIASEGGSSSYRLGQSYLGTEMKEVTSPALQESPLVAAKNKLREELEQIETAGQADHQLVEEINQRARVRSERQHEIEKELAALETAEKLTAKILG